MGGGLEERRKGAEVIPADGPACCDYKTSESKVCETG